MNLTISRDVLGQIRDEAVACGPAECCGLLLGNRQKGVVETIMPARNVAPDPRRHFEIDPAVLFAAHRAVRAGGPDLLGHYHSHPVGPALPSRTDAERAEGAGEIWLILGSDGQAGAWRADRAGGSLATFHPLALHVVASSHLASPTPARQ